MSRKYKNIFLAGMPGAGKSYWAEQIAAAFGMNCIDLDDMIEIRTGLSISTFFERFGETSFRELEQQTLGQIIEVFPSGAVVACGGGTPCFYDNLQQMKENGTLVFLDAPFELLVQRLEKEHAQRPLLDRPHWREELEQLYQSRLDIYRQADVTLPAGNLTMADFEPLVNGSGL